MKILRRRGWITDLQIIFGAELQKALEPRARVFRPLAFVRVRQQQRQTRSLLPLVFTGGDVLIDDRLGDVVEIAELRFPHHQRVLRDDRITVFEPEHARF